MSLLRTIFPLVLPVLLMLGCRDCMGNDRQAYRECSERCPWHGECQWDLIDADTGAAEPSEDDAWEACDWCCQNEYLHLR